MEEIDLLLGKQELTQLFVVRIKQNTVPPCIQMQGLHEQERIMRDIPVAAGKSSFDLVDTEIVFAVIDAGPDSSFLDLACGIGRYSIEIANYIGEKGSVYAVDLWQEGIDTLSLEIDIKQIKNIKTIVADISERLPLENNSIDSCLMATILHDLSKSDQKAAVQETARLVKSGGMLNILEFKKIDKGPGPSLNVRMDEVEIEELVTQYGFTKVAGSAVGEFNYILKYKKNSVVSG